MLRTAQLLKYAGYEVFNRTATSKEYRRRHKTRRKPPSEWIIVKDAHPAIISEDEARAAAALNRERSIACRTAPRSVGSPYPLTGGLFTCGRCGANMVSDGRNYYVCSTVKSSGGKGCGDRCSVRREFVERPIVSYIKWRFCSPKAVEQVAEALQAERRAASQRRSAAADSLARRLTELDREISRLTNALAKGLSPGRAHAEINLRLDEKRQIEQELRSTSRQGPGDGPTDVLTLLSGFEERFANAEPQIRKRMIRAFVSGIQLLPDQGLVRVHTHERPRPEASASHFRDVAGVGLEPTTPRV
jgi:hypothetical protein